MLTRRSFVGIAVGLSASMLPVLGKPNEKGSVMSTKEHEHEEDVGPAAFSGPN